MPTRSAEMSHGVSAVTGGAAQLPATAQSLNHGLWDCAADNSPRCRLRHPYPGAAAAPCPRAHPGRQCSGGGAAGALINEVDGSGSSSMSVEGGSHQGGNRRGDSRPPGSGVILP